MNSSATTSQGAGAVAAFLQPVLPTGGGQLNLQLGTGIAAAQAAVMSFLNYGTNTSNILQLSLNGYFASSVNINSTGVGIGTATPTSYTLQVVGSFGATGDITAFTSDERLKSKTGPITDALDKVCTLDTFTYTHNDLARSFGFTDKRHYVGISAQQVRKVQPEVVRIAPFDADGEKSKTGENYITVQYERLVPLLIEALKEERKAREALEESLGMTTRELRSLEARVKLLEQK